MAKSETNYYIQGEGYFEEGLYSGTRKIWWVDENRGMQVKKQPVPQFHPIKHRYFYRYLSPKFMKEFKNTIKIYNTILQEIGCG